MKYKKYRFSIWVEDESDCPLCGFVAGDELYGRDIHSAYGDGVVRNLFEMILRHADEMVRALAEANEEIEQ